MKFLLSFSGVLVLTIFNITVLAADEADNKPVDYNSDPIVLNDKVCNELVSKVEFQFIGSLAPVHAMQWYTACIKFLRTYHNRAKQTHIGGVHFPTIVTANHQRFPVSSTSQDFCWKDYTPADKAACCDVTNPGACFDNVFTYDRCCLGIITDDVPHFFVGPAMDMNVANAVHHWGTFDISQSYVMQMWIKPGDLVVDVGANIGGFTVPLAEKAGSSGKVIAFEPFRLLFQQLNANIALNGLQNVLTLQKGVGSEEKLIHAAYQPDLNTLSYPSAMKVENQYEGADIAAQNVAYAAEKEPIEVETLDGMLAKLRESGYLDSDRKVNFLKIDVEFMELDVVKGAESVLLHDKPIIWSENEAYFYQPSDTTFVETMMTKYNYKCTPMAQFEMLCLPEGVSPNLSQRYQRLVGQLNQIKTPHDSDRFFELGESYADIIVQ